MLLKTNLLMTVLLLRICVVIRFILTWMTLIRLVFLKRKSLKPPVILNLILVRFVPLMIWLSVILSLNKIKSNMYFEVPESMKLNDSNCAEREKLFYKWLSSLGSCDMYNN